MRKCFIVYKNDSIREVDNHMDYLNVELKQDIKDSFKHYIKIDKKIHFEMRDGGGYENFSTDKIPKLFIKQKLIDINNLPTTYVHKRLVFDLWDLWDEDSVTRVYAYIDKHGVVSFSFSGVMPEWYERQAGWYQERIKEMLY